MEVKGEKKSCGHFCANRIGTCCRCQTPANDKYWMDWNRHCKICRGILMKYPDGIRTQSCPHCKRVYVTYHKGSPVLAPLSNCGCVEREGVPLKL